MKLSTLKLDKNLLKGIKEANFTEFMPVQEATFPHTFKGNDVYVQSQTGSGKSAAFLISIFHLFLQNKSSKKNKALIIVPTRELAVQIAKEAKLLGKHLPFLIGEFYGGVGYEKQEKLLKKDINIIIGTPGRIIDFSESKKIRLEEVGIFVIDEADRLFDMGFLPDIIRIVLMMRPYPDRQTMLFSATLDNRVKNIAHDYMHEPVEIEITPEQITVENISQSIYHVGKTKKISLLLGIMQKFQPKSAIIFTNTKRSAVKVSDTLKANGINCQYIMGDLPQSKRLKIINDVKKGMCPFLVATDVAARGLHIDDLELVINYDLPENCENYVHRIGRTARAGKSGMAISLVCEQFVYGLQAIEEFINMKIPVSWFEEELYVSVKKPEKRDTRTDQPNRSTRKKLSKKPSSKAKKKVYNKNQEIDDKKKSKTQPDKKTSKNKNELLKKMKKDKIEDRLKYYKEKYGETFTVVDHGKKKKKKKKNKSLLEKIFKFVKKVKK